MSTWFLRNILPFQYIFIFTEMLTESDIKRHVRFHQRLIGILPAKYQVEDPNKIAILFFSLCSLSLLSESLPITRDERSQLIQMIYNQMVETDIYCSFVPSYSLYPHGSTLSATCFALQSLLILEDDLTKINVNKLETFVVHCQQTNGGFTNSPNQNGDIDLRFSMLAMTIIKIIKCNFSRIDVDSMTTYISSTQAVEGGFGSDEGGESHAGLTFCAVDALSISSKLSLPSSPSIDNERLLNFLALRQINYCERELNLNEYADYEDQGGFNGRLNKYADTCYLFWCIGSLSLLGKPNLINKEAAMNFLLDKTQNRAIGGFNKTSDPDDYPDPLHSFLGLACLSLLTNDMPTSESKLQKFDPQLVIPLNIRKHWESLTFLVKY